MQTQTGTDGARTYRSWSFFLSVLLFIASAMAADWPQWRGPNRDSVWNEKGLRFPAGRASVLWTVPAGGGYSSPIISDRRVYVLDSELQKPLAWERLRCFD